MPVSLLMPSPAAVKSPLLEGLSLSAIKTILEASTPQRFPAKTIMTQQGAAAVRVYLLVKGRARYFYDTPNGKRVLLLWLTPGGVFGGAAFTPKPTAYIVSTEAVRDSTVLGWDRATMRELSRRFPALIENFLTIACEYFALYTEAHVALTSSTAPERLAHILVGLSSVIGQKSNEGIELDVTNEELANAANITPFTASRLINEWQKRGAVQKHRGKILLRSTQRLFLHIA
jgi:CRP-like cAMP-binding protein